MIHVAVLAEKEQLNELPVAPNRRGFLHLKELFALSFKARTFKMLDHEQWTDFIMKLDSFADSSTTATYTPYNPKAAKAEDRGFKAFLQV